MQQTNKIYKKKTVIYCKDNPHRTSLRELRIFGLYSPDPNEISTKFAHSQDKTFIKTK